MYWWLDFTLLAILGVADKYCFIATYIGGLISHCLHFWALQTCIDGLISHCLPFWALQISIASLIDTRISGLISLLAILGIADKYCFIADKYCFIATSFIGYIRD